jgi:hypothetical protein
MRDLFWFFQHLVIKTPAKPSFGMHCLGAIGPLTARAPHGPAAASAG